MTKCLFAYLSLSFILCLELNAQEDYLPYQVPDTPSLDPDFHRDTIINRIERRLAKDQITKAESYAKSIADLAEMLRESGHMYQDWNDWETHIERFAQDLVKDGPYDDMRFRVKVLRDPEINAYATCAGYIFVNVGFLAEIESLEELKLVLAHEIGHDIKNHNYEMSINRNYAQSAVLCGSCLSIGCCPGAGILSSILANRAYNNSSRWREEEADQIAIEFLNNKDYPLLDAAKIYLRFNKIMERMEYFGGLGGVKLYGSTHPDALDRYQKLRQQAVSVKLSEPLDEEFSYLRNQARFETLNLLDKQGQQTQAILTGWRFLTQDSTNDQIKLLMLKCLNRLRQQETEEVWNNPIISNLVKADRELEEKLESQVLDEETIKYIEAMLLLIDLPDKTPIPWFASYAELESFLIEELDKNPMTEYLFVKALTGPTVNRDLMKQYIEEGGRYQHTARRLAREETSDSTRLLFILSELSAYTSPFERNKSYEEIIETFGYSFIQKQLETDGFDADVITKTDSSWFTTRFTEIYTQLSELLENEAETDSSKTYELARTNIQLSEYLSELGYDKIVLYEYSGYGSQKTKTSYLILELDNSLISSIQVVSDTPSWSENSFEEAFFDGYSQFNEWSK